MQLCSWPASRFSARLLLLSCFILGGGLGAHVCSFAICCMVGLRLGGHYVLTSCPASPTLSFLRGHNAAVVHRVISAGASSSCSTAICSFRCCQRQQHLLSGQFSWFTCLRCTANTFRWFWILAKLFDMSEWASLFLSN